MDGILILIPITISLAFFATIATIWISTNNTRRRRAQLQAEVQNRLIDRFGTAPELIAFLSSTAGREFMGDIERQPRREAGDRILKGVRSATVLSCVGLAFCLLAFVEHERGWAIPGLILLALGGGYILSSVLTLRLSKSWGLLGGGHADSTTSIVAPVE